MAKRFPRTSMMSGPGSDPADIIQGRVVNINLVRWTVDVYATFDRKRHLDVPISSPYLHYSNGEGLSIFPEVGSLCYICIPGDSSGPFVLCFTMPHEVVDGSAPDAPEGIRSHGLPGTGPGDATFRGNRPKGKPGDIRLATRDGNFVVLHRGGVLQIGSTELAQRIYVPLNNLITDISENYQHLSAGGTMSWGIQDGPSKENFPAQFLHTFRIFANDKYADIKLAMGKVANRVPQADSPVQNVEGNPTVMELVIAPQGFDAVTGDEKSDGASVKLHFLVDLEGNVSLNTEGNVKLVVKKKFELRVTEDVDVSTDANMGISASGLMQITGKKGTHVKGQVVRLGPGKLPVARQGDLVSSFITALPCVFIPSLPLALIKPGDPVPGFLNVGIPGTPMGIPGTITSGEQTVLA